MWAVGTLSYLQTVPFDALGQRLNGLVGSGDDDELPRADITDNRFDTVPVRLALEIKHHDGSAHTQIHSNRVLGFGLQTNRGKRGMAGREDGGMDAGAGGSVHDRAVNGEEIGNRSANAKSWRACRRACR